MIFERWKAQAKATSVTQHPNLASQCLKIIGDHFNARGRYKDAKKGHYMLNYQKNKNLKPGQQTLVLLYAN